MTATLHVDNLTGGYGRLTIFRDVNLMLQAGRTVGLLGANGAGKTTLLKTIVGALPATGGRVILEGHDLSHLGAFRRARAGLNLVPEGRHIFDRLTVQDNLILTRAVEAHRSDLDPFDVRLDKVYDMFPRLRERATLLGGTLSGGEQQMLAVARALLLSPKVLILDEPTQGLAPIVIRSLAKTSANLKGKFALLIVEQNQAFLEQLTDQVLLMDAGNLM